MIEYMQQRQQQKQQQQLQQQQQQQQQQHQCLNKFLFDTQRNLFTSLRVLNHKGICSMASSYLICEVAGKNYSADECLDRAESLNWFMLATNGGAVKDGVTYSPTYCLQSSVSLNPREPLGWYELGIRGGGEVNGQWCSQKDCLQKAITFDPTNGRAWDHLSGSGGGVINGMFIPDQICLAKSRSLLEHEEKEIMAQMGPEQFCGTHPKCFSPEVFDTLNNSVQYCTEIIENLSGWLFN